MADPPHAAAKLMALLGDELEAPDQETFDVFSHDFPSRDLGFVDPKAQEVDVTIAGKDYTIRQSPGLLSSNRKEGTTGAVVWKVTPLVAGWLSFPANILFQSGILGQQSIVLELGAGISGLVGLALAPKIRSYIATDQDYVLKLLKENIGANHQPSKTNKGSHKVLLSPNINVLPLDWETSSLSNLYSHLEIAPGQGSINALIACDCIYNESLIEPLVNTSRDICKLAPAEKPTICLVAQQLRSPDVFELWLETFAKYFRVWRVPDELLDAELRVNMGFVIHIGILKDEYRRVESP